MRKARKIFQKIICLLLAAALMVPAQFVSAGAGPRGETVSQPAYAYVHAIDRDGNGTVDEHIYYDQAGNEVFRAAMPQADAAYFASGFSPFSEPLKHIPDDPVPKSYDPDYHDNSGAFYPTYGEWVYEVMSGKEIRLIAYLGTATEVSIPSVLGAYTVVALGNAIFARSAPYLVNRGYSYGNQHARNITKVTLPNTIRTVYDFLHSTSVETIHIPESVQTINNLGNGSKLTGITVSPENNYFTTADGVLYDNTISRLISYPPYKPDAVYTLPDTVNSVSDHGTFATCQFIKAFAVNAANAYFSAADGVLFNKAGTELVRYPMYKEEEEYETPAGVLTIRATAFDDTRSLRHLVLSEGVENMVYVNHINEIETLQFPSTLTRALHPWASDNLNIYYQMFRLQEITVSPANTVFSSVDGVLYNKDKTIMYAYPMAKDANEYRIPDTVLTVVADSFWNNHRLERIYIPAGLQDFDERSDIGMSSLNEFIVDGGNSEYTAIDGVLYTKDEKVLVYYPGAKTGTAFTVPDQVEYINTISTYRWQPQTMQILTLPSNLKIMGFPDHGMQNNPDFKIFGKNSYARRWATYFGIPFSRLDMSAGEITDALNDAADAIREIEDADRDTVDWSDVETIISIIEDYDDLSETEKSKLTSQQIAELEELREKIAAINHGDGNVSVEGAAWNIRLEAAERTTSDPAYNLASEMLDTGWGIKALFDIKLTRAGVIHNVPSGQKMTLTITGKFSGLTVDTVRIFHVKGDYTTEYIVPLSVTATTIVFEAESFSIFGVVSEEETTELNGWVYENGTWYFYIDDVTQKDFWIFYYDFWYYLSPETGAMAADDWANWSNQRYYLYADGKMAEGSKWVYWKNNWYYLNDNDRRAENEWVYWEDEHWYYLRADGKMASGEWQSWADDLYYLLPYGNMAKGIVEIDNEWHEFGPNGAYIGLYTEPVAFIEEYDDFEDTEAAELNA